jgi:hypothetical protein
MKAVRLLAAAAPVVAALASPAAAVTEQVTIAARPSIGGWGRPITLFGSVDARKADEVVTIQVKDCGQQSFRNVSSARTEEGGDWSTQFSTLINTSLRAVWNDRASAPITVRARPGVLLRRRSARRFDLAVQAHSGGAMFWRKRALFQRFDRRLGTWATIRRVVLTEYNGYTEFTASVPKGALVRAVFPLSQARPCYLAGYSPLVRT